MRRELLLVLVVACGTPAADKAPNVPAARVTATFEPVAMADAGAPVADASIPPPAPTFSGPLPPPKPTTIPLSIGDESPGDKDLAAGDAAFEKGDNAEASARYEAAKKAAPKRGGPLVGLARIRIAKLGLVMDYAGAKGNKE